MIVGGVEAVKYRGATHVAPRGSIVVLQPDEAHSNWAAVEAGWSFKVIYPPARLLQQLMHGDPDQPSAMPFFADPVIVDRSLFQRLLRFHAVLEQSERGDRLKLESHLVSILQPLVARYATPAIQDRLNARTDHRIVEQIKTYLQAHYGHDPCLKDLSHVCGLSPFHLTRVFHESVGLPPHAYLTHLRIAQAKTRLRQPHPLTQIAIDLGFTDQSHFTKTFKAWVGVTPGQYRMQMQP